MFENRWRMQYRLRRVTRRGCKEMRWTSRSPKVRSVSRSRNNGVTESVNATPTAACNKQNSLWAKQATKEEKDRDGERDGGRKTNQVIKLKQPRGRDEKETESIQVSETGCTIAVIKKGHGTWNAKLVRRALDTEAEPPEAGQARVTVTNKNKRAKVEAFVIHTASQARFTS